MHYRHTMKTQLQKGLVEKRDSVDDSRRSSSDTLALPRGQAPDDGGHLQLRSGFHHNLQVAHQGPRELQGLLGLHYKGRDHRVQAQ